MHEQQVIESFQEFSNQKLQELIREAEEAIRANRAGLQDYTTFVTGTRELVRRDVLLG